MSNARRYRRTSATVGTAAGALAAVVTMLALATPASANMVSPPRGLQMNRTGTNLLGASRWIEPGSDCNPRRSTMDLTAVTAGGRGNSVRVRSVTVHWRGDREGRYGVLHVLSGSGPKKVREYRTNGAIGGPINRPETTVTYQVNDTFDYPVQFEAGESLNSYDEPSYCTNTNAFITFQGLKPPA